MTRERQAFSQPKTFLHGIDNVIPKLNIITNVRSLFEEEFESDEVGNISTVSLVGTLECLRLF